MLILRGTRAIRALTAKSTIELRLASEDLGGHA